MERSEIIIDNFLERLKREKTKKDYKRDIIKFIEAVDKDFLEVEPTDCKNYIKSLMDKVDHGKLAIATVEKQYSQLFSFFNFLEENEYMDQNPFKKIEKPKASRYISQDKIIEWEDLDKIITVLRTYKLRDYAALMLIFTSGLTLNDAVNLKWHQFFTDGKGNVGILFDTRNRKRSVKVHPDTWILLEEYRKNEGSLFNQKGYVFLNNRGEKITDRWLRMVLKRACKEGRIEKEYSPRDLRHTMVAHSLRKGAPAQKVKEQLGWSDKNLAQRYLYGIQSLEENAMDYLNFSLRKEPK